MARLQDVMVQRSDANEAKGKAERGSVQTPRTNQGEGEVASLATLIVEATEVNSIVRFGHPHRHMAAATYSGMRVATLATAAASKMPPAYYAVSPVTAEDGQCTASSTRPTYAGCQEAATMQGKR